MIYKGDTINYSDSNGFKQGKHIVFDQENKLPKFVIFYSNDKEVWDAIYSKKEKMIFINFYKEDKTYKNISKRRLSRLNRKREKNSPHK